MTSRYRKGAGFGWGIREPQSRIRGWKRRKRFYSSIAAGRLVASRRWLDIVAPATRTGRLTTERQRKTHDPVSRNAPRGEGWVRGGQRRGKEGKKHGGRKLRGKTRKSRGPGQIPRRKSCPVSVGGKNASVDPSRGAYRLRLLFYCGVGESKRGEFRVRERREDWFLMDGNDVRSLKSFPRDKGQRDL